MSSSEIYDKYTPTVRSMIHGLFENVIIPRIFTERTEDGPGYSGSVEVDGKLYALYFRRSSNMRAEVSVTRNSNCVKWAVTKDLFNEMQLQVDHHPVPGGANHAGYMNDPWLMMRIFVAYVDLSEKRGY